MIDSKSYFLDITDLGAIFVSDIHNNILLLQAIIDFFSENFNKKKVHYLIFCGDSIDRLGEYSLMTKRLILLQKLYPKNVLFLKGNHELSFNDVIYRKNINIQKFLRLLKINLLIKNGNEKIFCSHGSIPIYKDDKNIFRNCTWKKSYNLHCIYNFNEFSGEKACIISNSYYHDSFRDYGEVIPNNIHLKFLERHKINYCITGHVHKNQAIFNSSGELKHITICSSPHLRSGAKIPTAYVIFNDGKTKFLNLNDLSENTFIEDWII